MPHPRDRLRGGLPAAAQQTPTPRGPATVRLGAAAVNHLSDAGHDHPAQRRAAGLADAAANPTQLGLGARLRLLLWAVLEPLGVRQLHLWWRLKGVVLQLRGRTASWGRMPRAGFGS